MTRPGVRIPIPPYHSGRASCPISCSLTMREEKPALHSHLPSEPIAALWLAIKTRIIILLVAGVLAAPACAFCDTIFSSMPFTGGGIIVGGPVGSNWLIAEPVVPDHTYLLDTISVGASREAVVGEPGNAPLQIGIWNDLNGVPNASLQGGSIPAASIPVNFYTTASVQFSKSIQLLAGQTYWVVLSTDSGTEYVWANSTVFSPAFRARRNGTGGWSSGSPGYAFEVAGTLAPGPQISVNKSASSLVIRFIGILQQSGDLVHWADISPQPSSPWTFTPAGQLFLKSRQPDP
jgi:hypothetical protein